MTSPVIGAEVKDKVIAYLRKNILSVKEQKVDSKVNSGLTNTTIFGVAAKKARANDIHLHTDQQVFSCGSLAPKLKRARKGGCMDHGFRRDAEPWETSDGCIYLVLSLASLPAADTKTNIAEEFLAGLGAVGMTRHFAHHTNMITTLWTQMPSIAQAMGKKPFKRHLEHLLEPLLYGLTCENRLAENAAAQTVTFIDEFIGHNIFVGRLQYSDQLSEWEDALRKSPFTNVQLQ
jgi:hypothetical protein